MQEGGRQGEESAGGGRADVDTELVETWQLSDSGLAFRKEFDDVVILETRHRFVDPRKERVEEGREEEFVDDLIRFREVMGRLADLSLTREDHEWLSRRNRSRLPAAERKLFDEAVLLMDTKKQRVERGSEATQLDGAD